MFRISSLIAFSIAFLTCLPAFAAGITSQPDGYWGEYRSLTGQWLAEFNKFRSEKGLPPFVWSERMYAVLVEYALDLKKHNLDMKSIPGPCQRPTQRAQSVHRWNIYFYDNYTIWNKASYDPAAVIKTYKEAALLKSIHNPKNNAAAVAIVERNQDEVYIIMTTGQIDIDPVLKAREKLTINGLILEAPEAASADRVSAIKELALMKNYEFAPILIRYVSDRDSAVAKTAVEGLSSLSDPSLVHPLIRSMSAARADVQESIASALARITGRKEFGADQQKWLAWYQTAGGQINKPFEVPAEEITLSDAEIDKLIAEFDMEIKHGDLVRRIDAVKKLGRIRNPKIAKAVSSSLGDKEAVVRQTAAEALQYQADPAGLNSLSKAFPLNNAFPEIQAAIIRAFGAIGDSRALPVILKDFKPGPDDVTSARIEALGNIRHHESIDALIDFSMKWGPAGRKYGRQVTDSLKKLTGQDFGQNRDGWKTWWDQNKTTFRFPSQKK